MLSFPYVALAALFDVRIGGHVYGQVTISGSSKVTAPVSD